MGRKNEDLVEEHRQITAIARRIKDAQTCEVVIPLLPEFCAKLERHFAGEEEPDGLFDMFRKNAPERQGEVDGLAQQHRDMLAMGRALVERAQTEGITRDAGIVAQAHQLADALCEHEAAENVLLLDLFNTDIGASD